MCMQMLAVQARARHRGDGVLCCLSSHRPLPAALWLQSEAFIVFYRHRPPHRFWSPERTALLDALLAGLAAVNSGSASGAGVSPR